MMSGREGGRQDSTFKWLILHIEMPTSRFQVNSLFLMFIIFSQTTIFPHYLYFGFKKSNQSLTFQTSFPDILKAHYFHKLSIS
jgi:hypothetical protein